MKILRFLYGVFNRVSMEIRMLLTRFLTQIQMLLIPAEAAREIRRMVTERRGETMIPITETVEETELDAFRFDKVPLQTETHLVLKDHPDGSISVELRTDPRRDIENRIAKGENVRATVCESFAYATVRVLLSTQPSLVSEVTMPGLGTVRPTIYKGHAVLGDYTPEVRDYLDEKETGEGVTGNKPDGHKLH